MTIHVIGLSFLKLSVSTMNQPDKNILQIPKHLPQEQEFVETISGGDEVRVERIISHGHTTPEGTWYDQESDEWVVLIQGKAKLQWADDTTVSLQAGDSLFIPAHKRHRVIKTTENPPCVWLAIHGNLERSNEDKSTT